MKLLEGNVLSSVSKSVILLRGRAVHGPDSPIQSPGPLLHRAPAPPRHVQNLDSTVQGPPAPNMFKLVYCEAWTVGKRAVGIRLKCLLVQGQNALIFSEFLQGILRLYASTFYFSG